MTYGNRTDAIENNMWNNINYSKRFI